MNVALHRPWTMERFLAWEETQELRFEFDGVRPIAMNGGTVAHSVIQRNLLFVLTGRLQGKPCRPHGSGLKIQVAGRIRYPDAFVVCTPIPANGRWVTDPVVVFEILSATTAATDMVEKNAEYRATPSIQRYVILQQTHAGATAVSRRGPDWLADIVAGYGAALALPELAIEIPLAELYADLDLSEPPENDAA
jgi:Uma2 family endonuclease